MNNKYKLDEVAQALPQLNNPTIDPNTVTGMILNEIRKSPTLLESAKRYLALIKAPEPAAKPVAKAEKPEKKPAAAKSQMMQKSQ